MKLRNSLLLLVFPVVVFSMICASSPAQPEDNPYDAPADEGSAETATLDSATEQDAGVEEDASIEEPAPAQEAPPAEEVTAAPDPVLDEAFIPGMDDSPAVAYDDPDTAEQTDIPDGKPFAKGEMEPGLGLAMAGSGGQFLLGLNGSFAYYVINRLAPGIQLDYITDFGAEYPDSITLLPFLKFVLIRSTKFAPYLIAGFGREFQWGASAPYVATDSWVLALGLGARIGLGEHVAVNVQLLFDHHWYSDPWIRVYKDSDIWKSNSGQTYACGSTNCSDWTEITVGGYQYLCPDGATSTDQCAQAVDDEADLDRQWIYPIITIGMTFIF
jgi:hypothetical protein